MDDENVSTESFYEPARIITLQPLRRNLERVRKKPERYGQIVTNYITIKESVLTQVTNKLTPGLKPEHEMTNLKNEWKPGLKFWLNLLLT